MTNQQHPITPPPELINEWIADANHNEPMFAQVATTAARWGADQELEACCEYIAGPGKWFAAPREAAFATEQFRLAELRAARRPKPPSLKELALELVHRIEGAGSWTLSELIIVRRALEKLPE